MSLNFYQGEDKFLRKTGLDHQNNSLLFSTDTMRIYGKFLNNFSSIGEQKQLICEELYDNLTENEKLDNKKTWYIVDSSPIVGTDYNFPVAITINPQTNSLVIITNEAIS